jgi:hypothetical protein
MCRSKSGCTCHWAAELGPNRSRRTAHPSLPSPIASSRNPQNQSTKDNSLDCQSAPLVPPSTPIRPPQASDGISSPSETPPSIQKRKCPPNGTEKPPAKRRNAGLSNGIVFGVGPSDTPTRQRPSETDSIQSQQSSLTRPRPTHGPPITARHDIWAFMRAVNSMDVTKYKDLNLPLETVSPLSVRPKSDYVGCILLGRRFPQEILCGLQGRGELIRASQNFFSIDL